MIVPSLARMIVKEHIYKPISGPLLCLGRQTIVMEYEEVLSLFREEGYVVPRNVLDSVSVEHDQRTRYAEQAFITDKLFFQLLGVGDAQTMDVSDYEAADLIHDLNTPVPEQLLGRYEFIIDGGTFDHLFDLRVGFENVVRMLKPGGRVFQWNAASNFTGAAYISLGPDFFYDYYAVNQFSDCKAYIADLDSIGQRTDWRLYEFEGADKYKHFRTERIQVTVVLAEKGAESTYDRMPIQAQYRDADQWAPYRAGKKRIAESPRAGWRPVKATEQPPSGPYEGSILHAWWRKFRQRGIKYCLMRLIFKSVERIHATLLKSYGSGAYAKGFKYVGEI